MQGVKKIWQFLKNAGCLNELTVFKEYMVFEKRMFFKECRVPKEWCFKECRVFEKVIFFKKYRVLKNHRIHGFKIRIIFKH